MIAAMVVFMFAHETYFLFQYVEFWFVMKLVAPLILLFITLSGPVRLTPAARIVVGLYLLFIAYGHLSTLFSEDIADSAFTSYKYFMKIAFFFGVLGVFHRYAFSHRLISIWLIIGAIFSLQAIVLVGLMTFGYPIQGEPLVFPQENYGPDEAFNSYGILGYANFYHLIGDSLERTMVIRAQAYFSEASNLGRFLVFPMFLALGSFVLSRKPRYLVLFLMCALGCVLTRSATVGLALVVMAAIWAIERSPQLIGKTIVALVVLPLAGSLLMGVWAIMQENFNPDPTTMTVTQSMIGKGEGSLLRRMEWVEAAVDVAMEQPFGIGFVNQNRSRYLDPSSFSSIGALPLAPVMWLLRTGVAGLALMLTILGFVYVRAVRPYLSNPRTIMHYVALAFLAQLLTQVVHGNWIDPTFFIMMAMLLTPRSHTEGWEPVKTEAKPSARRQRQEAHRPASPRPAPRMGADDVLEGFEAR